ncbi:extensin-1-like [Arachis ipaensis]|uniref:extensin-1-like n=1 Tax=Arachis ipaensis TaxID=130454 RepID=UPI0007AF23DE|nr:extensin-1-like [Arachis ipaensis]XP_025678318.1 extensin-1-like [Arachis hypogaea]
MARQQAPNPGFLMENKAKGSRNEHVSSTLELEMFSTSTNDIDTMLQKLFEGFEQAKHMETSKHFWSGWPTATISQNLCSANLLQEEANGTIVVLVPPHPSANGVTPPPIPAFRPPPPPQAAAFQPMPRAGQPAWHQQQPRLPPGMPPPQVQQFQPPPQAVSALPPPTGMVSQPPVWRPQPLPLQQHDGRPMAYPQPSMPPPPSYSQMPPPQ